MRSKEIVVAIAALTVVVGASGAAYAQKPPPSAGHGKPTSSSWMMTGETPVQQCPGADTCLATGSQALNGGTSGFVSSQAKLVRTTPYGGSDEASDLSDIALNFTLSKPAKSVTADIAFSGVALGDGFGAHTDDGRMFADAGIGAEVVDSTCSDRSCGSTGSRVDSYVAYSDQVGPADVTVVNEAPVTGITVDSDPTQTVHVVLSPSDGSDVPAGTITIFAYVFAGSWLYPLQCPITPQTPSLCDNGLPHTGSAQSAVSATVSSIAYTVNGAA